MPIFFKVNKIATLPKLQYIPNKIKPIESRLVSISPMEHNRFSSKSLKPAAPKSSISICNGETSVEEKAETTSVKQQLLQGLYLLR